jgi:ABC-type phosphate transport system substrate-binding protein
MWNGSRQIIMTTRMASHIQRFLVCVALAFIALTGVTTQSSAAEGSGTLDIVVVVSQQNPIASLSRDHIEDIFLGRTQTFPNGLRAVPVDQAEGSAVREHFNTAILRRTPAQVRSYWSRILFTGRGRPPRSVASSEEVLRILATDPQAIGYIERRFITDAVTIVLE